MAMGIRPSLSLCALFAALTALGLPALSFVGGGAHAAPDKSVATQRKGSGLPIPRFASLRSDEVNVRTGPGARYPVDWVFKRKAMPVEIVAEYENWRKIRDWQGASGWVHQSLLTGKRSFIIPAKAASLHKTPATSAEVVAKLEPEVMGEIRSCAGDWCRVKVSGVTRLDRAHRHVGRLQIRADQLAAAAVGS